MSIDATKWAWGAPVSTTPERIVLLSLADRAGEDHTAWPSAKRLCVDTCLDRKTVLKVISGLIEKGILIDTGERKGPTKSVRVLKLNGVSGREEQYQNWDSSKQVKSSDPKNGTSTKNGTDSDPKNGTDSDPKFGIQNQSMNQPLNRSINKGKKSESSATKYDAKAIELPVSVNRDLWIQFVDMRNSIKKPLTENAVNLLIKRLVGFGEFANQSLEASIIGSYQTVYLPKTQTPSQNQPQRRRFGNQAANQDQMRTVGDQN